MMTQKRSNKRLAARPIPPAILEIHKKSSEELEDYVERRVSADPPPPPIDDRGGEENEDVLVSAYRGGDGPFRERVAEVLKKLCWKASNENPDLEEFSRVLRTVEQLRLKECGPHLLCILSAEPEFFKSAPGRYKRDLLLHVMVALQRIQDPKSPVVCWQSFLSDPKYAVPAYAGLIGMGLEQALEHLSAFLKTAAGNRDFISARDVLLHLFTRYADEDALYRVFVSCRREPLSIRRILVDTAETIASFAGKAKACRSVLFPPEPAGRRPRARKKDPLAAVAAFCVFKLGPALAGVKP
jgi:hypothetical protein